MSWHIILVDSDSGEHPVCFACEANWCISRGLLVLTKAFEKALQAPLENQAALISCFCQTFSQLITHFMLILWFMFYSLFAKSCVWSKVPTQPETQKSSKVTCTPPVSGFQSHQSHHPSSQSPGKRGPAERLEREATLPSLQHLEALGIQQWEGNWSISAPKHPGRDDGAGCAISFRHGIKVGPLVDLWLIYGCCSVARVFRNIWMLELETAMVRLKKRLYSMHHQLKWVTGPLIAPKSLRRFDFDVCAEA